MRSIDRIPGALVVWIASYIFFLSTLVNNFSASHDSIHYLLDILNGNELFHQHHLLYNFLAAKWQQIFSFFPPHYAIESFTALWGSSVLTIVYNFFRNRFALRSIDAALGTAIIGCSYGVWFYSVNIEVYMPPLFFILASLYRLTTPDLNKGVVRQVALLNSMAVLFHQINVLFALVVIWSIFNTRNNINKARLFLEYAAICVIMVGGMYFIAGWFFEGHHSLTDWLRWMEGYSVGHDYWQGLSLKTPAHVLTGFSHAFIGGHFVFQLPAVQNYLLHSLSEHGLADEIFLSSKISSAMAVALCMCTVALGVLILIPLVRLIGNFRKIPVDTLRLIKPMLLTILVYSVFFCFWMPEILEFWIPQMVLVWMILIGTIRYTGFSHVLSATKGLALIAMLIFTINFFGSVRWLQDIRNDWYFQETVKVKSELGPDDLVIVDNEWILKDYLRYYTPATVLATDEAGYSKEKERQMTHEYLSRQKKVFVYRGRRFTRSY